MRRGNTLVLSVIAVISSVSGCRSGYSKALFFTKTNIGFDISSQPPTMEISFSRREGVIEPVFEDGQTPPVLASFSWTADGPLGSRGQISSAVSGGDAALTMSRLFDDTDAKVVADEFLEDDPRLDSSFSLTTPPTQPSPFGTARTLMEIGEVEPFTFATDTSYGLRVAWSTTAAVLPDTITLGYNRKEFALAPITLGSDPQTSSIQARMPSFLATVDNDSKVAGAKTSSMAHVQYFATGKAADKLARRHAVREAMFYRLDPAAVEAAAGFTSNLEAKPFEQGKWLYMKLGVMYNTLHDLATAEEKDETAEALLAALNQNAPDFGVNYDVTLVEADLNDGDNIITEARDTIVIEAVPGSRFMTARTYIGELHDVAHRIDGYVANANLKIDGQPASDVSRAGLTAIQAEIQKRAGEALTMLNSGTALEDAVTYFKRLF